MLGAQLGSIIMLMSEFVSRPGFEAEFKILSEDESLTGLLNLRRSDLESLNRFELEEIYKDILAKLTEFGIDQFPAPNLKDSFDSIFGSGLPGRRKKHLEQNIHSFAVEHILNKIAELKLRRNDFLKQKESEFKKEQLSEEENRKKSLEQELNETVKEAEKMILEEWNRRKKKLKDYTVSDQARLAKAKRAIKEKELRLSPEEKAFREEVRKYENLLAFVMDDSKSFGSDSVVIPADEFDDIIGGVDFAVKIKSNSSPLLVDLTHSLDEAPDKLFDHLTMPLKKLAYPTDPSAAGSFGLPIVMGNTFQDVKELVDDYFREKITEVPHEPLDEYVFKVAETILPQLRDQQEIFNRSPADLELLGVTLKEANEIYDSALEELENKKGSLPNIEIDYGDPWVKLLTHPLETVKEKYPDL